MPQSAHCYWRCVELAIVSYYPYIVIYFRDRHFEWGHMRAGKLVHRQVSAQHAAALRSAIANYRLVKKLLRDWEVETERLIDAEQASKP
jgi:hypothetical protein